MITVCSELRLSGTSVAVTASGSASPSHACWSRRQSVLSDDLIWLKNLHHYARESAALKRQRESIAPIGHQPELPPFLTSENSGTHRARHRSEDPAAGGAVLLPG